MEKLKIMLDFIAENKESIFTLLSMLLAFWQSWGRFKDVKTAAEAKDLLINVLKDDDKMDNYNKFDDKIIEKVEKVAETLKSGKETISEVKKSLSGTVKDKGFVKVGSYKGKPIYLTDVLSKVGFIKRIFK